MRLKKPKSNALLLQPVVRHVGLDVSKIDTALWISPMINAFDSSKKRLSSSVHTNGLPGLRSAQKGYIHLAEANALETWLTGPNQLRTLMVLRGVGKY